jgi:hypothetical protein
MGGCQKRTDEPIGRTYRSIPKYRVDVAARNRHGYAHDAEHIDRLDMVSELREYKQALRRT